MEVPTEKMAATLTTPIATQPFTQLDLKSDEEIITMIMPDLDKSRRARQSMIHVQVQYRRTWCIWRPELMKLLPLSFIAHWLKL